MSERQMVAASSIRGRTDVRPRKLGIRRRFISFARLKHVQLDRILRRVIQHERQKIEIHDAVQAVRQLVEKRRRSRWCAIGFAHFQKRFQLLSNMVNGTSGISPGGLASRSATFAE